VAFECIITNLGQRILSPRTQSGGTVIAELLGYRSTYARVIVCRTSASRGDGRDVRGPWR
jgi:hypothetical protein